CPGENRQDGRIMLVLMLYRVTVAVKYFECGGDQCRQVMNISDGIKFCMKHSLDFTAFFGWISLRKHLSSEFVPFNLLPHNPVEDHLTHLVEKNESTATLSLTTLQDETATHLKLLNGNPKLIQFVNFLKHN